MNTHRISFIGTWRWGIMRRMRAISLLLVASMLQTMNVFAAEENGDANAAAQWKEAANLSLQQDGAESPYYSTGQWNDPNTSMTMTSCDWFNYKDYTVYSDPYYGLCLLKNAYDTSQVEANPSVGIDNVVDSTLAYGCLPDFSNLESQYFPFESIGITEQEYAAIPLPAVCTSWRYPADYEEDMLNYSEQYNNLIWAHKGKYWPYSNFTEKGLTGREIMEWRLIDAAAGVPIGCHVNRFSTDGIYSNKQYGSVIKSIEVKYPCASLDRYCAQKAFKISYGPHAVNAINGKYYDDMWTVQFIMYPNEMDMRYLHGLLRLITPDAEEIYSAIKTDLYGDKEYGPWHYEDQDYNIGYAPWKYYDKWYDIGTQSRICSSYTAQTEDTTRITGYGDGCEPTCFIYRIAPRVGVNALGYGIRR